jgi:hypothetical protein
MDIVTVAVATFASLVRVARRRTHAPSATSDRQMVGAYLRTVMGLVPPEQITTYPPGCWMPFELCGGRLVAYYGGAGYLARSGMEGDVVCRLEDLDNGRCIFCGDWRAIPRVRDAIVLMATQISQRATGHYFVQNSERCRGCAETFVILVSIYMAIRRRPVASPVHDVSSPSSESTSLLPADCLHRVVALLNWRDRRSAAAVSRQWRRAAGDVLLASVDNDVAALLAPRFAMLPRNRLPTWNNINAAWVLTDYWLRSDKRG